MSEPGYNLLEEIFTAALDRPREERVSFLEEACHGNEALKSRVLQLLAAHDRARDILPAPSDGTEPGPDQ